MLRIALPTDFEEVEGYAVEFLESTEYGKHYDLTALRVFLTALLDPKYPAGVIFLSPNRGMLAARCTPFLFGQKWVATEVGWWVKPECRKQGVGKDLLGAFEAWAKKSGCSLVTMISLDDELGKFYEKAGYTLVERAYLKEI